MTAKTYKRIGNISFALAIAAVLSFDAFRNPLIPGLALVSAGAIALGINMFARFRPLDQSAVATENPGLTVRATASSPIIRDADADRQRLAQSIVKRLRDAAAVQYATTGDVDRILTLEQYHRFYAITRSKENRQRHYIRHHLLTNTQQTAIDIAKALNPQPTEYEVILTSDGTLRISPKARAAQDEPQKIEFQRPRNLSDFQPKLVN